MINRYVLDFEKTFVKATLLKVEPKMERSIKDDPKSPMEHGRNKDGVPKYTAFLSVETRDFDKTQFTNISVTLATHDKLDEVLPTNVYVTIEELDMGIMKNERSGHTIFYSAKSIRPLAVKQAARAAAGQ